MTAAIIGWLVLSLAPVSVPRVGVIDYYGLKNVSRTRIAEQLGFKEGDPLPPSKADVELRLESVEGVVTARLEAVCCEGDAAIVFVGIEERGAPRFEVHPEPASDVVLPEEILSAYRESLPAYEASARTGKPGAALQAWEIKFEALAKAHATQLREVLRDSSDADQRAVAAHVIAFGPDKQAAAVDLQYALQDPEIAVRRTALRSLDALALYGSRHPEAQIKISPTWPVEMLHSIAWGDRTGAVELLLALSEGRDARVLELVRERALTPLLEMARWKSLTHALPAFLLLGRLGGWSEDQIHEAWNSGERDKQLAAMEKAIHARR